MNFTLIITFGALGLFLALLGALELGTRTGRRLLAQDPESPKGTTAADGLVYALLGLLLAFSFSGAAGRFERRRELIVAESNALGTAWLRLDLLPATHRDEVKAKFRAYFDARLAVYEVPRERAAVLAALDVVQRRQEELWTATVQACSGAELGLAMPVLPPLNESFDLATERTQALLAHPPVAIFLLLTLLALGGAFLAGQSMAIAKSSLLRHRLLFAGVLAVTIYTIVDLEYPRLGFVRVDAFDAVLYDLRATMK